MRRRRTRSRAWSALACFALLAAGLEASAGLPVRDREVPDLDRPDGAVLDLATGALAIAPRPRAFSDVEAYKAALAQLGDLAYEDAQGGMLFVASGFAVSLGEATPEPGSLQDLAGRLEARDFLRREELAPGAWLAVRARSGGLSLARVVARTGSAIRLAWSPPRSAKQPFTPKWVAAIAARGPARTRQGLLPPLGSTAETVLHVSDATLRLGPPAPQPLSADALASLVDAVSETGDLAYLRPRSGRLVVASGKVAQLGTGPVAALSGRDLGERLRDRAFVSEDTLTPGSVLLVGTTDGRYALVRIDAVEPKGLRISWLVQPDGSARFTDLAAFDATFETPEPRVLDGLLLTAATRGDAAEILRLLALGANANTRIGSGARPALVHAVIDGDAATIALLLAAGADPEGSGDDGWNALHVATRLGRTETVKALLEAGAEPGARTLEGLDVLGVALATPGDNVELIRLLRAQPGTTDTLLLAARVGDVAAMRSMLAAGSDADLPQYGGRTPLEIAAAYGQSDAVSLLLEAGADPSLETRSGDSALVAAVSGGHLGAVARLVEHGGSTVDQQREALLRANVEGAAEIARVLLEGGTHATERGRESLSPLEHAMRYGDAALVDTYVEQGFVLDIATAARLGRLERLDALLAEGQDPHRAAPDGRSPLQLAIENHRSEAVQVLLEHGVAPDAPLATWDGRAPLHEAAAQDDARIVSLLLERGANVNRLDRVGRSPLYNSVVQGHTANVRMLLAAGADPNLAPAGEALLDIARGETIRALLIDHGALGRADTGAGRD
ncbi:MAG: ankyrin repeat domain-containing protein [Myxococcota bacterium]|nr:ankyrin repeat domain-containing protein [Myxococcota bacterium]